MKHLLIIHIITTFFAKLIKEKNIKLSSRVRVTKNSTITKLQMY